jgi:CRP-like cAMP-binding protein
MSLTVTSKTLTEIPLIKDLSPKILTELVDHARIVELSAGDVLFKQDDLPDAFYLIEDGQLHIERHYETGEYRVLTTLGPYETLGEMSALANQPRAVTVTAVSDCMLIAIERASFLSVIDRHPEVASNAMMKLAAQLHATHLNLHEYASGNPEARLANLLLLMADNETGVVSQHLKKHQVANAAAVDDVWLDRTLRDWARNDYLTINGREVILQNIGMMREIAGLA